jgi:hypothetical protein
MSIYIHIDQRSHNNMLLILCCTLYVPDQWGICIPILGILDPSLNNGSIIPENIHTTPTEEIGC